ncbi:MAG: DUF58 domain-containing protein [Armatimonadetes bacterium]|nr:DUF58 domain-containing protein [Armatimonadota bacterium]
MKAFLQSIVPTKWFWLALALGIPLAMLAEASGRPFLIYLYNFLVLAFGLADAALTPSPEVLRFEREMDPVLSVRQQNKILARLTNDGNEPIKLRIRDELPALSLQETAERTVTIQPGKTEEITSTLTPLERGADFFRGVFVRISGPLGLVEISATIHPAEPVRVYPNVLALRKFDFLNQKGRLNTMGIRRSRQRGLGSEFESLKEYTPGNDFRKIDWKASGRRGKLIVREYEAEKNQSVMLLVDAGRAMLAEVDGVRKIDRVLDSILLIANAVAMSGDSVGLMVYADTVIRYIPPKRGRAQVGIIIEAIHDLLAEPIATDHARASAYLATRWKRRSLVIAFTDLEDKADAEEWVRCFSSIAKRHLMILGRVSDPKLHELYDLPPGKVATMYSRAAVALVMDERKTVASVLGNSGIHHLEAEPDDLAAALVSFYFRAKERSLI